jgi:polyhydroxyalkanoate synthesis regulator phasin
MEDFMSEEMVPKARFEELTRERNELRNELNKLNEKLKSYVELNDKVKKVEEKCKTKEKYYKNKFHEISDEMLLKSAKAINIKAARALLDNLENIEDDDEYKEKRQKEINKLIKGEDTKFLFKSQESFKGVAPVESCDMKEKAKNPFSKDGWNLTEQGKLFRENPNFAKALARQAGAKIF